ncbi:MAG: tetraacyldisaccharide 4'-kinase [Simkaniaceae bacterium]|nr:tetraacyldisaccharide 4'-kinase [Candidatus Sacchlamyda saccharinae]
MNSLEKIIRGEKKAPLRASLLKLLSHGYHLGIKTRGMAYDHLLKPKKLNIPVISVGNIVAGGTGKTPIIEYLAKALAPKHVAILSRGYRRQSKKNILITPDTAVEECGDEPYLLQKRLPEATIIVGANRVQTGHLAEFHGAEVILLDDGMQHRKLHRDIEIVVMQANDLFGGGHFLPRGFLRDHPKRLETADHILINGAKNLDEIEEKLRPYSDAPLTSLELRVENSHEISSKKVAAFCAIGNPKNFYKTLKTLGCDIVETLEKSDHLSFSSEELQGLANGAKGASILVCTEKDAVKLPKNLHLPIIPVKISLSPTLGKEHLEKTIFEVKNV